GTLSLQTGPGVNAAFTTTSSSIAFTNTTNTLTTAGGSLSFSAGTDLTVCNLNTNGGDVSLTAGTAAAGNLTFGNIQTSASGNITLQATNNAGGSITQSGLTVASGLAINATATGNIAVNALRGTSVDLTSNTGSVSSTGSQAVQASAELTVDAATGITLNTLANLMHATNSTSGDISIIQAASPSQTLIIVGTGVVNDAAGGSVRITNQGASIALNAVGNGVISNNGLITLAATDLQLNAPIDSGLARTTLTTSVAGEAIDLGTNVPGQVGLTESELSEVTARVLQIGTGAGGGGAASAGTINVSAAISNPAGWNVLSLVN